MREITKKQLSEFWLDNYCTIEGCCLCGNSGRIDCTNVSTPLGKKPFSKYYCVCPNGRAIKKANEKITK